MELVNSIAALSIILTGAALVREREHGTVEHLLGMPLTPFEIMESKVWFMGLTAVVVASLSLLLVVQNSLDVPIQGSLPPQMLIAPTTHFVSLAQAILYRGADFGIVWAKCQSLLTIGSIFFSIALIRFHKSIGSMV